jgi:hypothetical protein
VVHYFNMLRLISGAFGPFTGILRALCKRVIRIGRVYQGQSIALIALCRHPVENDTDPRDNNLQRYSPIIPRTFASYLILNLTACRSCVGRRGDGWEEGDSQSQECVYDCS